MNKSVSVAEPAVTWVDSQHQLEAALSQITSTTIAIDTEFVRTNTYFPKPGIIQLCVDHLILLIDPQTIDDWSPLSALFKDPHVLKVIHACNEDLELFYCQGIAQPKPLFDTQIAFALLGGELNQGLQKMLQSVLNLRLEKHATRSDWTQRPLTEAQLSYATEDVRYLLPLWRKLQQRLTVEDKLFLVLDEGECLTEQADYPLPDHLVYQKLRGGWKLKLPAQKLLARLAAWREQTARQLNRPRGYICTDEDLLQIAQYQPASLNQLSQTSSIRGSGLRRHGKVILDLVKNHHINQENIVSEDTVVTAMETDDSNVATNFIPIRGPLPKQTKDIYKAAKQLAAQISTAHNIQPTLLASRSMLEECLHWHLNQHQGALPQLMKGWRRQRVGDSLSALIVEKLAQIGEGTSGRPELIKQTKK